MDAKDTRPSFHIFQLTNIQSYLVFSTALGRLFHIAKGIERRRLSWESVINRLSLRELWKIYLCIISIWMGNWWMVKRGETRIGEHEGPELWKNHLPSLAKWFSKIPLRNSLQTSYAERFQDGRQRKQGMESAWLVNHRVPKPYSNSIDGMWGFPVFS